jgi:hypothetical protein
MVDCRPYTGGMHVVALTVCTALTSFVLLSGTATAATVADQQSSGSIGGASSSSAVGQSGQTFTAGVSGLLTRIVISELTRGVIFGGSLTLNVLDAPSGMPVGSAIASQAIPDSSVPLQYGQVTFAFSSPASIVAGRKYAFALVPQSGEVSYGLVIPGSYVGGEAIQGGPTGWGSYGSPTPDLLFTTFVDTGDEISVSAPPVLQQFGKPASAPCDAAAPATLNWGGAGSGGWGESWAQWMNGGLGGAVCTRTLVYNTTQAKWVVG